MCFVELAIMHLKDILDDNVGFHYESTYFVELAIIYLKDFAYDDSGFH